MLQFQSFWGCLGSKVQTVQGTSQGSWGHEVPVALGVLGIPGVAEVLRVLGSQKWVKLFYHPVCLTFLVFFRSFFSQLIFRLLHLYSNSLVCLAILFLEIIPKTV